jgi:hypothetical protein
MNGSTKKNVTRRRIWARLFFMIVLSLAFNVAELITFVVVAFQFLASLFTGEPNDQLTRFGRNLARYLQQITVFLTFATEEKPFPFTPWPDEPHEVRPAEEDSNQLDDKSANTGDAAENEDSGDAKEMDDTQATDNAKDADKSKD